MLCPVSDRHIQNNCGIFSTLIFQVYVSIFNHIQCYQGISTHIETFLRHIQAYSGIFSTLSHSAKLRPEDVLRASSKNVLTSSGLPYMVLYVTLRDASAARRPWVQDVNLTIIHKFFFKEF